jgi:hypothetical protein
MFQLSTAPMQQKLSDEILRALRDGLATCSLRRGLSPEAQKAIAAICGVARDKDWTPEQLVILVKEVCYTSPEISHLTTASEREALLATIVTGCINEYYSPRAD